MKPPPLVGLPKIYWRCSRCHTRGEVSCNHSDAVDQRWDLVLSAHRLESPQCDGDAGIAILADGWRIPA